MKKLIFIIAGISTLLFMALHMSNYERELEHLTLDLRFNLFPDLDSVNDSIVIIGVDDASLESMNWLGWPWPRQIWSDITAFLYRSGVQVVYFDITFSTSSTFSAGEDSVFGAVAERGNTVFITGLGREEGQPIPENALIDIDIPQGNVTPFRFASPPVEAIAAGAALLASPYAFPDPDGIFRKTPLFFPTANGAVPSPALAIAMLFRDDRNVSLQNNALLWSNSEIPLTEDYEMQVRFAGSAGSYRAISVADLFSAMSGDTTALQPSSLAGKIVMIGYTASDLMDLKPIPYSARCPGVEVIANAVDNVLTGRHVATHGFITTLFITLLLSLAVASALVFIPRVIPASLTGLFVILAYGAVCLYAFKDFDLWLKAVPPLASGILTLLGGSIVAYQYATKDKKFLKAAFSQYLSPAIVSLVAKNPEMLKLGGEKKVMTAFFSDIAGFTTISEKLDPTDLVKLLNIYLTEMTDIILESGGTVDKFEGDAIIAFWGAPVEYEDHALRAVTSALECQRIHADLNRRLKEINFPELHTRMGLASGSMVVGNMGSNKRFDYTMMGTDVNLASRLEGVNKVYSTPILISNATKEFLPESIKCREIDTVMVMGQKTPVTIWEPVLKMPAFAEKYNQALQLYRNGDFPLAMKQFLEIEEDGPSRTMSSRCRKFIRDGTPSDWEGTWVLTSK
ncbi:MAG: adenylate/guanylate cyclase domain-containing protein [Candidatus Sabulitectum sp.]|nr:adenylate/guanylate cyclase domain-containing protein [Candidatus Sabulitectum sp.]